MKTILLLVSFLTISFNSIENSTNVDSFLGKWKSFEGELIDITLNYSNEVLFKRYFENEIVSQGIIDVQNDYIAVIRTDTLLNYKLNFAFSIDGQTLVVMKPNSKQAWILNKISD